MDRVRGGDSSNVHAHGSAGSAFTSAADPYPTINAGRRGMGGGGQA
jgi:hypothetical protein